MERQIAILGILAMLAYIALRPKSANASEQVYDSVADQSTGVDVYVPGYGTYSDNGTFTPDTGSTDIWHGGNNPTYFPDFPTVEDEINWQDWDDEFEDYLDSEDDSEARGIPDGAQTITTGSIDPVATNYLFNAMMNPNMQAFLAMIRYSENKAAASDEIRYRTLYGMKTFDSFADHPSFLGWPGVPLPDRYCIAAGFSPGCKTTAAGAYQMLSNTWREAKQTLRLPDFSPDSQDAAAVLLIRRAGAMPDVLAGRFESAIRKTARTWASLPGAGYSQPENSITQLRQIYASAGGQFATV